jgi:hypothetical protein
MIRKYTYSKKIDDLKDPREEIIYRDDPWTPVRDREGFDKALITHECENCYEYLGHLFIYVEEYENEVNYCPYCGYKSKNKLDKE